jgi:hypothetical protein
MQFNRAKGRRSIAALAAKHPVQLGSTSKHALGLPLIAIWVPRGLQI